MSKVKNIEITIKQASDYLGVSERMVLNYVKSKEIFALKVGKKWFLKKSSVDAFKQRHGFQSAVSETDKLQTAEDKLAAEGKSLNKLAVFKLIKENLPQYAQLMISLQLMQLQNRLIEFVGAGFYSFGSRNKCHHYLQARATLGAMIAHLRLIGPPEASEELKLCNFLEQVLMPAFSSLIRHFEKSENNDQKRPTAKR